MRLTDVLELATHAGVRRFVEKRAGIALPLTVGAMIPGVVEKAVERSRSTEKKLEGATGHPFKTAALPLQFSLPLAQMMQSMGKNVGGPLKGMGSNVATGKSMANAGSNMMEAFKDNFGQIAGAPGAGVAKGITGGIGKRVEQMFGGREFGDKKDVAHMMGGEAVKTFGKEMGTSGANLLRDMANKAMEAVGHAGDASAREAILGDLKRTDSVLAGADDTVLMEAYHTMTRFAPVLSTDKNAVRSFLRQAVMSGSGPDFMTIKHLADSERAVTGEKDRR